LDNKTPQQAKAEALAKYKSQLPHLYGYKFFRWSREFWESTNPHTFLCVSNQSGKSIISIRKAIRMATDTEFQKRVFQTPPDYGFYFYPSLKLATREFKNKWVKQVLPRGEMKDDPKYGWSAEYKDGEIYCINFNIGTKIYFMSYNMKVDDLQAASPHWVSADEEMPIKLWGEISARLLATKGMFSLVCTPTKGEEFWRGVFDLGKMPGAKIIKATMYETVSFEDGSPGMRTIEEIENYKAKLPNKREIDVRVYAKFTKAEGAIFPNFDRFIHCVEPLPEAKKWPCYVGIDIGSGGSAHPAAITFTAVRPDFREGRVIKTWRGNITENTSSVDILRQYQEMKKGLNVVATFYDHASAEFKLTALAENEMVLPGDKHHEVGISIMNTLLKHGMLLIEKDESPESLGVFKQYHWETLAEEIENCKDSIKKKDAEDDQVDSFRYSVTKTPFDLSHIGTKTVVIKEQSKPKTEGELRREQWTENLKNTDLIDDIDAEIEFWNDLNNI
jgi:hypothetical protein